MDYTVIWNSNIHDLILRVKTLITDGWKPLGGICTSEVAFYQAMIKEV